MKYQLYRQNDPRIMRQVFAEINRNSADSNGVVLCATALRRLFDVPKECEKCFLDVRIKNPKTKGFKKLVFSETKTLPSFIRLIKVGERRVNYSLTCNTQHEIKKLGSFVVWAKINPL